MPPRIWPENPVFMNKAEELVFDALYEHLDENSAIITNLRVFDAQYGDVEIDCIALIDGYGAAVIETKGGSCSYNGQIWLQSDATGPRKIYPRKQALQEQYSLRNFLNDRWNLGNLKTEWLLAFPDSLFGRTDIPDVPRIRILDRAEIISVIDTAKKVLSENRVHTLPHDPNWVDQAFEAIRGHATYESDREVFLQNNYEYIKKITHDQEHLLDAMQDNNRIYFSGSAGSGKSWLAFEQAHRWVKAGLNVGIAVYNRGIASYMQRKVEELPENERPAFVGTFDSFAHDIGSITNQMPSYIVDWDKYSPIIEVNLKALPAEEKFDAWVIDEAQDFQSFWWPLLEASFKDPANARMAIFADPEQSIYHEFSVPLDGFSKVRLPHNIRNSQEIADFIKRFVDHPAAARGPHGYVIEFVTVEKESDVLEAADDAVERLAEEEVWNPGQIALLTTKYRHPEHDRQKSDPEKYWQGYWDAEEVFYGTVQGFKGLERSVVVLAVNGIHPNSDIKDMLYVGASRARDRLVVVWTSSRQF